MSLRRMSGVWYGQTGAPVSQAIPILPIVIEFRISQTVSVIVTMLAATGNINLLLCTMHRLDTGIAKIITGPLKTISHVGVVSSPIRKVRARVPDVQQECSGPTRQDSDRENRFHGRRLRNASIAPVPSSAVGLRRVRRVCRV
jgi:hypothetical protein